MKELILKLKRILNIFKKEPPKETYKKVTPIYMNKRSDYNKLDKYMDNYSPIKYKRNGKK